MVTIKFEKKTYSQKKSKTICMQFFVTKLQTQDKKVRNKGLFGHLLYLPIIEELDLKTFTSLPLTFAHIDELKISFYSFLSVTSR